MCITADMSFKSRLEADFKREYQNVEFLFRQRPGLGGMAALPPSVAQVPGKYLCFLVTRVNDRNTIDPEHVMLALTRLRDFMIERGITEVSMPVYDPNREKLIPRELYAILHVVFAETEIMVHLHKKYLLLEHRLRPGLGGMAALPPSVAQVPGKYLCFPVTRVNDRNTIDPEHVMLALTRLRDFMIERGITEVSMPVYDPNREKLSPRELYAILHVVFAETEIMVHLHKKYYLSIA